MKNVYIGKESINGNGLAICRVIDSDIATEMQRFTTGKQIKLKP